MTTPRAALFSTLLAMASPGAASATPVLDWAAVPLPSLAGGVLDPALFSGKVVLVVNTASQCGFTPQYEGLQALWTAYRDRGLVVLGVPSNDFGAQEPDGNQTIAAFCQLNYGVDFPMLEKQAVKGDAAHPLFRWAVDQTGPAGAPRWNFFKYLVGRDGRLVDWFSSVTGPDSSRLKKAVEAALAVAPPS